MTFGVPIVALLTDVGGWRPPFYVVGGFLLVLWGLLWVWFPGNKPQPGHTSTYISHLRAVGSKAVFWYALLGNFLQLVAFMGMFRYLAAYLIQIYYMKAGKTAFPLMLTGLGVITGTIMGGRVAGHRHRLALISICFLVGGLIVPLLFVTHISPWITVGMSFCITSFLSISWPVLARLSTEMAGKSRATAMGMLAMSNQFAGVVGASIGGVMLSLGSFPLVGIFCCATAAAAAVVVRYKVRESA